MTFREMCLNCRRAKSVCQCLDLRPFHTEPFFVILIHPIERRMKTGTGRLAHLCLRDSVIFEGTGFADDKRVNSLIEDPRFFPVVLYPGKSSADLSELKRPQDRRLLIFVIDSTWNLAKTMLNRSPNLTALPQVRFTPKKLSNYRIRRQPKPICLSTIEAIHQMLECIEPGRPEYNHLIEAFDRMVERQLGFAKTCHSFRTVQRHRK